MKNLYWSKKLLGNKLVLLSGEDEVGSISWSNLFSSKAHAMINGRRFILNREFFISKLEIYDANNQELLGTLMVNVFNPRSDVVINGKRFELEINNFWQSRWAWKFNGSEIISYQSNEMLSRDKGQIELSTACCDEVEVLLLLGLFVRNQFVLFMLLLIVIFVLVFI